MMTTSPSPGFGMIAALLSPGVAHIGFQPESGPQFWLLHPDGSWACLDKTRGEVEQGGGRSLWGELEQAYDRWHSWGEPGRDRFGITVQRDGTHDLWLDDPETTVAALR